jgi:regulatory protein
MADQTPLARAKAIALRQLAARPRTGAQLRARLAKDDLAGEADAVLAWLSGLGYLDDAAYARGRARSLLGQGRLGPRAAERRLIAAGIPAVDARAAVREALGADGADPRAAELALCRGLAERRARGAALDALEPKARARLARFLAGRGFVGATIARVLGVYEDAEG